MANPKSERNNFWIGLFVLVFGIVYGVGIPFQVSAIGEGATPLISGRTLPVIITVLLILLGGLLTFRSFRDIKDCGYSVKFKLSELYTKETKRMLVYLGAIFLYLVCIPYIGYLLASIPMIIFGMRYNGYKRWLIILSIAVITPLIVYLAFHKGMYMPMPESLFDDFLNTL